MAVRMFLPCKTRRVTIMSVRRTLSETEIEKYGRPKLIAIEFQMLLFGCEVWYMNMIPIATLTTSAQNDATGLRRTRVRTHRGEVHEAGEGDNPVVHGVDNITTIELEEATCVRYPGERLWHKAYQKTIGEPIVQEKHEVGNDTDGLGVDEELISKRPRR